MDGVTVGQVMKFITWVAAGVGAIGVIYKFSQNAMRKLFSGLLNEQLSPLTFKLDSISNSIVDVDMAACKNFLVRFLADIEQGKSVDEVERERFHEVYSRYQNLGGNSYIHTKVEKLKNRGKL